MNPTGTEGKFAICLATLSNRTGTFGVTLKGNYVAPLFLSQTSSLTRVLRSWIYSKIYTHNTVLYMAVEWIYEEVVNPKSNINLKELCYFFSVL